MRTAVVPGAGAVGLRTALALALALAEHTDASVLAGRGGGKSGP